MREAENSLHNAEATISAAKEKVSAEDSANGVRQRITSAYSRLMSRLQRYRENLPSFLLADLGHNVIALYNAFNRRDHEGDSSRILGCLSNLVIAFCFPMSPRLKIILMLCMFSVKGTSAVLVFRSS